MLNNQDNTGVEFRCLFEFYKEQPKEVAYIIASTEDIDSLTYEGCEELQLKLAAVGYTFDWYLDALPFNLRKMPTV